MKSPFECRLLGLVCSLAMTGACGATTLAGPAGASGVRVSTLPIAAAAERGPAQTGASTQPSLDLITGVVQAVDVKQRTLKLGGRTVGLHPTKLRIVQPTGHAEADIGALRPGMHIRFALEPTAAAERAIVLIYIGQ